MYQNIGIFCASSNRLEACLYAEATRLGEWIGEHRRTLVYGGVHCGLMEAVAQGVSRKGGEIVGVVPQIAIDKHRVSALLTKQIVCRDLAERKELLVSQSDVIVVLPGSVGTLDEVFTVMAAHTIGIHQRRLIFWNIDGFWNELFKLFDALKRKGVINMPMEELYTSVSTLDELTKLLD